jgi:N-formylglutamate deformylase
MSTLQTYVYHPGTVPVLLNMPHTATHVPPDIMERLSVPAQRLPDTDWHIERLYSFARDLGVHMLIPTHSRYVVDLNRGEDNASLYPGKFTTGICPLTLFDGSMLYQEGKEPDEAEISRRIEIYWRPYHEKLQSIIDTMKLQSPQVAVFDAHSICSRLPKLFEGVLPDLNIGTADGISAGSEICNVLVELAKTTQYSMVYNGRFKGGYITRYYGKPTQGVHVMQLELAQKNYMDEAYPFAYDEDKASKLQIALKALLNTLIQEIYRSLSAA